MAFTFGIVSLSSITGADPISGSESDDTSTVGTTVGDVMSFSSAADVAAQTADGDYPDDGGATLIAPVTINGVTYPAGSEVEADWEVITQDPDTGLYYRITGLYIENDPVGVAISRAWDASTGQYVAGDAGVYQPGTALTQIDGDDLDDTPNQANFTTDSNYADYGGQDGIGNDAHLTDSNGVVMCFTRGTRIATPRGEIAVEALRVGDLVSTLDSGDQPLRYIGRRTVTPEELRDTPQLAPVRVRAGVLGHGLPRRDLVLSPQHRLLLRSKIAQRMYGSPEVLVAARQLRHLGGVAQIAPEGVEYFHLLFDRHEIVLAEGAPAESLYLGDRALNGLPQALRDEVLALFPELRAFGPRASRPLIDGPRAKRLVLRHRRNRRTILT
ncbi:Hint domain-containing protein [Pseudooceanicola nanhaiensis]|uniref:Hint domain-containing protein n=1 Tax=Pseudooceanicola nanhaiensis TaxID=375761 RepID=UPI001CD3A554|nr:Hint domain-containing protein [Pseudooceanicola nanhaiensis]MCA0919630.1 Hint domain-containing protein [Pseudooceanicola nanhaiensis]